MRKSPPACDIYSASWQGLKQERKAAEPLRVSTSIVLGAKSG